MWKWYILILGEWLYLGKMGGKGLEGKGLVLFITFFCIEEKEREIWKEYSKRFSCVNISCLFRDEGDIIFGYIFIWFIYCLIKIFRNNKI